jgi:hypothetical protein
MGHQAIAGATIGEGGKQGAVRLDRPVNMDRLPVAMPILQRGSGSCDWSQKTTTLSPAAELPLSASSIVVLKTRNGRLVLNFLLQALGDGNETLSWMPHAGRAAAGSGQHLSAAASWQAGRGEWIMDRAGRCWSRL